MDEKRHQQLEYYRKELSTVKAELRKLEDDSTVMEASAYRYLRDQLVSTMDDPDRWYEAHREIIRQSGREC